MSDTIDYEFEKAMREKETCDMVEDFMKHALKQPIDVPSLIDMLIQWACWTYVDRIDDAAAAQEYILSEVKEYFLHEEIARELEAEDEDEDDE